MVDIKKRFKNRLKNIRSYDKVYEAFWKSFLKTEIDPNDNASKFRILLINTPCMGFGDIVFAMKLYQYLKEWYSNADIYIATTQPENFKKLGADSSALLSLIGPGGKIGLQCKRVSRLFLENPRTGVIKEKDESFDMFLVAPVTADFAIDRRDIKNLFPNSNRMNTFFFSEYNDSIKKNFDFPTGVGGKRYGLLFTDNEGNTDRLEKLPNPYSLIYITDNDDHAIDCYLDFVEMVTRAQKHPIFDIVIPKWIGDSLRENVEEVDDSVHSYYKSVYIDGELLIGKGKGPKLVFRTDVLPLPYSEMVKLYNHSEKQILITGDQSITDVISCCSKELTPFYQIVPWKRDFAKNLAKYLPQKFIKRIETTCGSINGIKYHPSMEKFKREWDFRKNAREKLDAIVNSLTYREAESVRKAIRESKTVSSLRKKLSL